MSIGFGFKKIFKNLFKELKFQLRELFKDDICNDKCPYLDICHAYKLNERCVY